MGKRRVRRGLMAVLAATLLAAVALVATPAWATQVEGVTGEGTAESPWEVGTADQLKNVLAATPSDTGYIKLTAGIDAETIASAAIDGVSSPTELKISTGSWNIDLNGQKLDFGKNRLNFAGTNLTIQNSGGSEGIFSGGSGSVAAIKFDSSGTFTLKSGTIQGNNSAALYLIQGTAYLNGGTVVGGYSDDDDNFAAVTVGGTTTGATLTVNGATVKGQDDGLTNGGIYVAGGSGNSQLTVQGDSVVMGDNAISTNGNEVGKATISISGGHIVGSPTGAGLYLPSDDSQGSSPDIITITGGEISGGIGVLNVGSSVTISENASVTCTANSGTPLDIGDAKDKDGNPVTYAPAAVAAAEPTNGYGNSTQTTISGGNISGGSYGQAVINGQTDTDLSGGNAPNLTVEGTPTITGNVENNGSATGTIESGNITGNVVNNSGANAGSGSALTVGKTDGTGPTVSGAVENTGTGKVSVAGGTVKGGLTNAADAGGITVGTAEAEENKGPNISGNIEDASEGGDGISFDSGTVNDTPAASAGNQMLTVKVTYADGSDETIKIMSGNTLSAPSGKVIQSVEITASGSASNPEITLPEGVTVTQVSGKAVTVKSPYGTGFQSKTLDIGSPSYTTPTYVAPAPGEGEGGEGEPGGPTEPTVPDAGTITDSTTGQGVVTEVNSAADGIAQVGEPESTVNDADNTSTITWTVEVENEEAEAPALADAVLGTILRSAQASVTLAETATATSVQNPTLSINLKTATGADIATFSAQCLEAAVNASTNASIQATGTDTPAEQTAGELVGKVASVKVVTNEGLESEATVTYVLGFVAATEEPDEGATVAVYRLYNQWEKTHLYTTDANEAAYCISEGWSPDGDENGIYWYAPAEPTEGTFTIVRFYNPYSHDHYYCPESNQEEIESLEAAGWTRDSVASNILSAPKDSAHPVFTLFNPYAQVDTHLYTPYQSELDALTVPGGWQEHSTVIWAAAVPEL